MMNLFVQLSAILCTMGENYRRLIGRAPKQNPVLAIDARGSRKKHRQDPWHGHQPRHYEQPAR